MLSDENKRHEPIISEIQCELKRQRLIGKLKREKKRRRNTTKDTKEELKRRTERWTQKRTPNVIGPKSKIYLINVYLEWILSGAIVHRSTRKKQQRSVVCAWDAKRSHSILERVKE